MKNTFIVSFIGEATPKMLKSLATITHENGGKWLISKVNFIDQHVAAIIKVEVPAENADYLKTAFTEQASLTVHINECDNNHLAAETIFKLRFDSSDRAGIVNDITNLLDSQNIRVLDMNCQRIFISGIEGVANNLFSCNLSLKVPIEIAIEDVIKELESLGDDTRVMLET
jgi:glycine cleavage system regulatory protein